jgi:hypothetical protein
MHAFCFCTVDVVVWGWGVKGQSQGDRKNDEQRRECNQERRSDFRFTRRPSVTSHRPLMMYNNHALPD